MRLSIRVQRYAGVWVGTIVALATAANAAGQAAVDTTPLRPALLIPEEQEMALARSAAPDAVARQASIWVLGKRGYEQAVRGTNGWGCIVQRGTSGQGLIPRCDDPNGVETLYPLYFLLEETRAAGHSAARYKALVQEAYQSGKLRAPQRGGLSYMYSTDAVFVDASGKRYNFTPHVMIYWPDCKAADLGVAEASQTRATHLSLLGLGTPECHLIINTPPDTERKSAVPVDALRGR
jgi:hypothetical protein